MYSWGSCMLMHFCTMDIPATLAGHDESIDFSGPTNLFFNVPIDSISHSTTSPDFRNSGRSEANIAIPDGAPVMTFVGYLPSLASGGTLTTEVGSVVTVTIQGNDLLHQRREDL